MPGEGGSQIYLDYYKIEEMGTIEPLTGKPSYLNESSRLSTRSSVIQDNVYYQHYAYDIRSKQDFKDYTSVIESAVHPAGFKRYGTKLAENFRRTSDLIDVTPGTITQLTTDPVAAYAPTWSPDGTKIAFESRRDGNYEIYVMDADGSNQTNITNHSSFDASPAWSPDGTKIAFQSKRDGNYQIYVMDADGSNQTRLTNHLKNDEQPAWSPNGTQIAFGSARDAISDGNYEIYVMDADGSNQTRLTNDTSVDSSPAWSPDGTQIAFESYRDGNWEIYVMDADGDNQTNITNDSETDRDPAWSPDGNQIAFHAFRDGNPEIYTMNADGTNQTNITNHSSFDASPAWSPDGTQIAFTSDRDGDYEIYVMDVRSRSDNNFLDTFSPDSINALAGWWKADAIGPSNIEYKRWSGNVASNGIFGTNTNRLPVGISPFLNDDFDHTLTFVEDDVVSNLVYDSTAPIGDKVLKITDKHVSTHPDFYVSANLSLEESDIFSIVLAPEKQWLFSAYVKTNNLVVSAGGSAFNTIRLGIGYANTVMFAGVSSYSGCDRSTAVDTWERVSAKIDLSSILETRAVLNIGLPDRTDFDFATGNTIVYIDGMMLEEYDSGIHTASAPYTPSPYVRPGLNGANVLSWYDSSLNNLHAYANVVYAHGVQLVPPQYVANTGTGHPAIRFRSNGVSDYAFGGLSVPSSNGEYPYSSLPGGDYFPSLTGKDNPANPDLYNPITNTFTGFVVARTNYRVGDGYISSPEVPFDTRNLAMFYTGHRDQTYQEDAAANGAFSMMLKSGLGSYGQLTQQWIGTDGRSTTTDCQVNEDSANTNSFNIYVMGAKAEKTPDTGYIIDSWGIFGTFVGQSWEWKNDLYDMYINGKGYGGNFAGFRVPSQTQGSIYPRHSYAGTSTSNGYFWLSELQTDATALLDDVNFYGRMDFTKNAQIYSEQLKSNAVFSIGCKNASHLYQPSQFWDGDIAEIIWFNEKLTSTEVARVEGYLAHKYKIQDKLKHKDTAGNPYGGAPPRRANVAYYAWSFTDKPERWTNHGKWVFNGAGTSANFPANATPSKGGVDYLPRLTTGASRLGDPAGHHLVLSTNNASLEYFGSDITDTYMYIDLHSGDGGPIPASLYDKVEIRLNLLETGSSTANYKLKWTTLDDETFSGSERNIAFTTPVAPHANGVESADGSDSDANIRYIDLSGESDWAGYITGLRFDFRTGATGARHQIDYIRVYGTDLPHPYRYDPPPVIGANTWYRPGSYGPEWHEWRPESTVNGTFFNTPIDIYLNANTWYDRS
jgi:Tol biopolymer transport system component